jgi:hypothetical protein
MLAVRSRSTNVLRVISTRPSAHVSTAYELLKDLLASYLFCPTGCEKHHSVIKSEVQKQEHLPKSGLEKHKSEDFEGMS